MTSYTSNLVLKNFMIKSSFEFSLTSLSCGDITGFLTSSKNDLSSVIYLMWMYKVFDGSDGCCVEGSIGDICFKEVEIRGVPNLTVK
jgi:hypothetical protein